MVEQYLPLVRRVANSIKTGTLCDTDDLIQEGLIAVWRWLPAYDPARKVPLLAFLAARIRGAMLDHLRDIAPLSRSHQQRIKDGLEQAVVVESLQFPTGRNGQGDPVYRELLSREDDPGQAAEVRDLLNWLCRQLDDRQKLFLECRWLRQQIQEAAATAAGVGKTSGLNWERRILGLLRERARHWEAQW